ncbi:MAG TPA: LamG-like jellyroll fold domain-containing protein [Gaiellales bacterium]|nr:LamG-like jellyroll fold domain-containing protein [Gaiellales bacterium]
MRHRLGKSLAAAVILTLAVAAPASAATLADWEMNEPSGATTMIDSSGHVNGTIGSAVQTGVSVMGATVYRWPFASPTAPPPKPERIVQANSNSLNPGSGTYTVSLRYRTTQHFGNIVQKGQAGSAGGYFKVENPHGQINCVFRGVVNGTLVRKAVTSPAVLSDGNFHVATCTRTANALTLTIDGSVVDTAHGSTGNISNTRPVTIGGKLNCDQIKTTCDYYTGDIDWVKLSN